jgi:hypothetical protein
MPMPLPLYSFAKVVAATAAMIGVMHLVPNRSSVLGLALAIAAGIVTYAAVGALVYARQIRAALRPGRPALRVIRS